MGVAAPVAEPAHLRLHSIEDDCDKDSVILGLAPGPRQEVHLRAVVVLHVVDLGTASGGIHPPALLLYHVIGGVTDVLLDECHPGVVYGRPTVHHAVRLAAVNLVDGREVEDVDESEEERITPG